MAQTKQQTPQQEAEATASEPLVDAFLQHQVRIQGLSADEVRKFAPFLKQIDADIRKRLSGDNLTEFSKRRLTRLLTALDATLADVFDDYVKVLQKDMATFGPHEAAFTVDTMETHMVGIDMDLPTASQIRAAVKSRPLTMKGPDGGKLMGQLIADWTKSERDAVTLAIRKGVVEGQTNSEIVRAIRGTKALKYNDGILATTQRHARAVVNTAVQHVSSAARQEVFDANDDIVKGVRWIATLDRHTCFVAGTPVDTPDGPKPIEALRDGDVVIGGSGCPRKVLGRMRSRRDDLVRVCLSNGRSAVCTADHRWLTKLHGWIAAKDLTNNMELATAL